MRKEILQRIIGSIDPTRPGEVILNFPPDTERRLKKALGLGSETNIAYPASFGELRNGAIKASFEKGCGLTLAAFTDSAISYAMSADVNYFSN